MYEWPNIVSSIEIDVMLDFYGRVQEHFLEKNSNFLFKSKHSDKIKAVFISDQKTNQHLTRMKESHRSLLTYYSCGKKAMKLHFMQVKITLKLYKRANKINVNHSLGQRRQIINRFNS